MAQQTLDTATELLHYQLRSAQTMEADSLAALGELAKALTAMGVSDAVALLQANLEQEEHTAQELQTMLHKVAGM